MGQRFQILIETDDSLYCYHCQWLWGEYAIRRLGSFVYAVQKKIKAKVFYDWKIIDSLQWAFTHELFDQNSVYPYFDSGRLRTENLKDKNSIRDFLNDLDNNNGQFLIKIKKDKIVGYAFYNPDKGHGEALKENQGKLIDWKEYLKDYENGELLKKFNKKQTKEFERGKKIFEKLPLLKEFPDIEKFRDGKRD